MSGMSTPNTTTPASSYARLMAQLTVADNVRGRPPVPAERVPTRPVDTTDHRPRTQLTGTAAAPAVTDATTIRTDDQARGSARRLLRELGWDAETELTVLIDPARQLLWLQSAAAPTDADGSPCDCGRCQQATDQATDLPGEPRPALEAASVTPKGELNLTRGLLGAIGTVPGAPVLALAFPQLHAVAMVNPTDVLTLLLAAPPEPVEETEAPSRDRPDNVTPLHRRSEPA